MGNTLVNILQSFVCGESAKELSEYNALADSLKHILYDLDCINPDANYVSGADKAVLTFVCLLFLLFFIWLLTSFLRRKNIATKLRLSAATVLAAGFIVYYIGFFYEGSDESIFAMVLRPLMSSLEMFVSHSDLLEVSEKCKNSPLYMSVFSIVHAAAVFISGFLVILLLGQRLTSWLGIKIRTGLRLDGKVSNLYVFFDINDSTLELAKTIPQVDSKLIFIVEPVESEEEGEKNFMGLMHGLSCRNESVRSVKNKGIKNYLVAYSDRNLSGNFELGTAGAGIWNSIGVPEIIPYIRKACHLHIFLFSSDESDNLNAARNLLKTGMVESPKTAIYCKARNSYVNRAAVNEDIADCVHLVDDSALSVQSLKLMTRNAKSDLCKNEFLAHPINYVEKEPRLGIVSSAFTAMIIGSGTTGQDALRFLYEYGSFVDEKGRKSPFKCYLIDKEMKKIEGMLKREIPALNFLSSEIELLDEDWESESFRTFLLGDEKQEQEGILDKLNYVVIATGDDERNMTIATELYECAIRYRKQGVEKFSIFVRSYKKENEERMKAVANYYKKMEKNDTIVVFGTKKEIYSYEMIVRNDMLECNAKRFFKKYQSVTEPDEKKHETWEERHKVGSDIKSKLSLKERLDIERKENEDYSNCIHAYTKLQLMDWKGKEPLPWADFPFVKYPESDLASQVEKDRWECMYNLSHMEHLRWNASHYMRGYLYKKGIKDARLKLHQCILPFEDLTMEQRSWDYAVVQTTIELHQEMQ